MASHSSARGYFWRFSVRQLLVLAAVLGVLLAVLAPHVQSWFRVWRAERELWKADRELYDAFIAPQLALKRAIVEDQGADRIREALAAGAKLSKLSIPMDDLSSPLHYAITRGKCETVEVLLDCGAEVERSDLYNPRPGKFATAGPRGPPLFAAVDCDQPTNIKIQMIRIFLAHGADIRCERGEENLMDLAARHGDGAIADLLREHGLPYGPREMAACNRIAELQRTIQESPGLLHEGFKPLELVSQMQDGRWETKEGQTTTLLGVALSKNYRDMARMLIEAGAPLNAVEPLGQTPLHIAATWSGDPQLIRLLIAHGADVNAVDDDQLTPLAATHHWEGREAARAALMEAGAK